MNGTSGFQEVRSSIFRSPSSRPLHEQRHQCETGSWHVLRAKELLRTGPQVRTENSFLLSTSISIHSCVHIRSIHIDESVHPFTLPEQIQ
jgi:hypothetical protein